MKADKPESLAAWEAFACLAVVLAGLACLGLDSSFFHPGFGSGDEASTLERLQRWLEGGSLMWRPGRGCLYTGLLALSVKAFGPSLASLRVVSLLAACLQALALGAWVRQRHGERAAACSMAFSTCAACALLWQRSLLSFSLLPSEMLLLLAAWPRVNKPWQAAAWGLAASLCLLDYEGWIFGMPVLLLLCPGGRPRRAWACLAAGGLAGLALEAWLFRDGLATYWTVRSQQVPGGGLAAAGNLLGHLRDYFGGAQNAFTTAFPGRAVFPAVAWPALACGLAQAAKEKDWRLLAGLGMAFAPLAAWTPSFEAHRAIAAWPLLSLLAGRGAAAIGAGLGRRAGRRLSAALMLGWLAFGFAWEARAYEAGMSQGYAMFCGQPLAEAGRWLRQAEWKDANLLVQLDHSPHLALQFLSGRKRRPFDPAKPTLAWIPWAYAPKPDPTWGRWHAWAYPGRAPIYLLEASPAMARRLAGVDADLQGLWMSLPDGDLAAARQKVLAFLDQKGRRLDPWTQTACWEAVGRMGFEGAGPSKPLLLEALRHTGPSATLYIRAALHEPDPAVQTALARQALRLDSHRKLAWNLALESLLRSGKPKEAAALAGAFRALPPGWAWEETD